MLSFLAGAGTTERNEGKKRKRVKREEMRRWYCATCFETVSSRGTMSFCGGMHAAAGAEIFVRVYRYSQDPISRELIIKYELMALPRNTNFSIALNSIYDWTEPEFMIRHC